MNYVVGIQLKSEQLMKQCLYSRIPFWTVSCAVHSKFYSNWHVSNNSMWRGML